MQEGADADLVVFDPEMIADRSTFEKPMEPSVGVHFLIVGGTTLIDDGKMVEGVYPGRAIVGPGRKGWSRFERKASRGRLSPHGPW